MACALSFVFSAGKLLLNEPRGSFSMSFVGILALGFSHLKLAWSDRRSSTVQARLIL
jgi:hypothetical protein